LVAVALAVSFRLLQAHIGAVAAVQVACNSPQFI
jgi:hypothetical protein